PFLMLISDKPGISDEVRHFSEWQSLRIHRLRTVDDLDLAVRQGLPSAIAWDFDQSTDSDWQILQNLYSHPALCEVPFLLFGRTARKEPQTTMTNIRPKPVRSKTLLGLINEIYVDDTTGSILIVDDDPDARAYLEDIVSRQLQTYKTKTAPSGREALAIIEQE